MYIQAKPMIEDQNSKMPPVKYMLLFAYVVGVLFFFAATAWLVWAILHIFFQDIKYWQVLTYCYICVLVLNWHGWHKDRYSIGSPWLLMLIFYAIIIAVFLAVYYFYHAL
jgi:hypothetical protein